jgi:hypothetical protein
MHHRLQIYIFLSMALCICRINIYINPEVENVRSNAVRRSMISHRFSVETRQLVVIVQGLQSQISSQMGLDLSILIGSLFTSC